MKEAKVEEHLKDLEQYGFEVLKLVCPAYNGVMDRMILAPVWSPAPPTMVELKAPEKKPRRLQAAVADNWVKRGVDVREYCDTIEKVDTLVSTLLLEAVHRVKWPERLTLPNHITAAYKVACVKLNVAA